MLVYIWFQATSLELYVGRQIQVLGILILGCQPRPTSANFLVRTTEDGRILNYTRDSIPVIGVEEQAKTYTQVFLSMQSTGSANWRNDTTAPNWSNYILRYLADSDNILDPYTPLSNSSANIIPALENMHRRLFSVILSQSPDLFKRSAADVVTSGTAFTTESRVFINDTSFMISVTILTLNLIVATLYYLNRPAGFLPRMPTSIASIFAGGGERVVEEEWEERLTST